LVEGGLDPHTNTYIGDKWGGKYLRAPDIFIKIIEKFSEDLVQLKDFCEIKGYIHDNNTGPKFPNVKFLKSIKNSEKILINETDIGIIQYGVKNEGESRLISPILFPRTFNDRHLVFYNKGSVFGKEFYKILTDSESTLSIVIQLNSTFGILQRELWGLINLGEGGIKFNSFDVEKFYIIKNFKFDSIKQEVNRFLTRKIEPISIELSCPDRRTIDDLIFSKFQLTQGEINEIYSATENLVSKRLEKAKG
jgi:hypothetical protein